MRKILSLITALVLCTTMMSAKTIYCKMEQGWWKADNAAVGCHTWGNPGPGTDWPGVRMTPVQGETDLWSIDLDLSKVQNVIFTRVNASGAIADWGAKTKDLTIPTGDNNLFTITSSSAVWGDPGCEGKWSVYNAPVVTEPTITDIAITGDKYVGTELTFAATVAGFSENPMIIYEVKAAGGEYEQAQGGKFTPAAAGDYTVKATAFYLPEDGDAEEAFKEVNFTITEAPKVGIIVNVTVPDGTPACFFYGEMSGNTFVEMDKVDDTHYTTTFANATSIGWGYKFVWENGNWNTCNADPEGDIKVEPVEGVINVEVKAWATAPGTEYKYTTYTEWQVKYGPAWEWVSMIKQEGGTFTVEAVWGNTGINIASGENPIKQDWYPLDDAALSVAKDVAEGDNVVITLTVVDDETVALNVSKGEDPQPEVKYFAKNNWNGAAEWSWLEMVSSTVDNVYMLDTIVFGGTGVNINDKADDADALYFAADEIVVLNNLDGIPFPYIPEPRKHDTVLWAPRHSGIVLDAPTLLAGDTIKLYFDASDSTLSAFIIGSPAPQPAGITVNVTVPDGTPACFFYGEMSGNTFVEMDKVDETHYTTTFANATSIGWGYLFAWENGNWNTKNAEGDFTTEPVNGVINVEVKAWATAPGTEYKYTTYTEWQVKYGPAWEWVSMIKQESGYFTVEAVWGNTGINIASGENPIKQDWYPLDDAALTVAEDVVEGSNVVITLTVVDDETVALNVVKVTPIEPDPDYGLLVNGTDYLPGAPDEKEDYIEYAVSTTLSIGDFVQLYDKVAKVAWVVEPEGAGFTNFDIKDNAYYIKQAGAYQFYIKIPKVGMNSGLYVGFQEATGLNTLKGQDGQRYNILGQPVNETYRGMVIMNGQTFLQK